MSPDIQELLSVKKKNKFCLSCAITSVLLLMNTALIIYLFHKHDVDHLETTLQIQHLQNKFTFISK